MPEQAILALKYFVHRHLLSDDSICFLLIRSGLVVEGVRSTRACLLAFEYIHNLLLDREARELVERRIEGK